MRYDRYIKHHMPRYIQISTTVDTKEAAEKLAAVLVEERRAACVQICGPVRSTYRWQGKIERTEEWKLDIKTRANLFESVSQSIRNNHPYELPEIVSTPFENVSADYGSWMERQLHDPKVKKA